MGNSEYAIDELPPDRLRAGNENDVVTTVGGVAVWAQPAAGGGGQFPIGWMLISQVNVNPATFLGYGTWTNTGAGRVLVGLDSGDVDFDAAGKTPGAKTVAAAGSCSAPTFTGSALGTHSHGTGTYATNSHSGASVADHAAHTHSVTSNVAVANHNVTQPSDHAAHTHAVTAAGTNSAPTFTGSALATHAHELPFIKATGGTGQLKMLAQSVFGSGTSRAPESISAAPTANTTAATVALSEAKSAGTPAGTVSAPTFTGSSVTSGNPSATLSHSGTAVDAHAVTNNAVTSGNPSATLSHSVTQPSDHTLSGSSAAVSAGTPAGTCSAPSFIGAATSVVQPSLVVYFWVRTA